MLWVGDPGYTMTPDTDYAVAADWDGFVEAVFDRPFETEGVARFLESDGRGDIGVAIESGKWDGVYPVHIRRDPRDEAFCRATPCDSSTHSPSDIPRHSRTAAPSTQSRNL